MDRGFVVGQLVNCCQSCSINGRSKASSRNLHVAKISSKGRYPKYKDNYYRGQNQDGSTPHF